MIGCKVFSENDLKLMEEYMTIAISTALPHAPYHLVRDLYTLPHTFVNLLFNLHSYIRKYNLYSNVECRSAT